MAVQLQPMSDGKERFPIGSALTGLALVLATVLIGRSEGLVQKPYRDPAGILTVCYGHTGKDIQQRKYSKEECTQMLQTDIQKHVPKCLTVPLTEMQQAAFTSLAYNIGVSGFCKSSVARLANAGDMAGACKAIELHNKARVKGKLQVLPGLVKRRAFERALCENDSSKAAELIMNSGDVFPVFSGDEKEGE